jgi:hypothetical protein
LDQTRRPSTLDAGASDLCLQRFLAQNRRCALKGCPALQEIYENSAFHRFRWSSVEIIEDFFRKKVIHSLSKSPTLRGEKAV